MNYSIKTSDGTVLLFYKTKQMEEGYKDNVHCYDELKFVRIKNGCGVWDIGKKRYSVKAGDILIMSRSDIRTVSEIIDYPFIIEQIDFLPAFLSEFHGITDFFIKRTGSYDNLLEKSNILSKKFDDIIYEIKCDSIYKEQSIKAKLSDLVIETARLLKYNPDYFAVNKQKDIIIKAMGFIKSNFNEKLSLEAVASKFYLSPSYFSRLFRQYAGMTFNEYVANVRVNEVIQLLNNSQINILDAAMQCGFSSSSGFYKTFRHITGFTPKAYKE